MSTTRQQGEGSRQSSEEVRKYTYSKRERAHALASNHDDCTILFDDSNIDPAGFPDIVFVSDAVMQAGDQWVFRVVPERSVGTGVVSGYTVVKHRDGKDPDKGEVLQNETLFTQALQCIDTELKLI